MLLLLGSHACTTDRAKMPSRNWTGGCCQLGSEISSGRRHKAQTARNTRAGWRCCSRGSAKLRQLSSSNSPVGSRHLDQLAWLLFTSWFASGQAV